MKSREPEVRILVFACNWCAYMGADVAGVSRFQYSPNVRIIRVMCTGRIDPIFILKAFYEGIDGVIVAGCHPGDCHYVDGNLKAEARVRHLQWYLRTIGVEPDRVRLEWISASEGEKFARVMQEMVEVIKRIGTIGKA